MAARGSSIAFTLVGIGLVLAVAWTLLEREDPDPTAETAGPTSATVEQVAHPTPSGTAEDAGGPAATNQATTQVYEAPATSGRLPDLAHFVDRTTDTKRVWPDIAVRLPRVTESMDVAAVEAVLLDRQDEVLVRHEAANLLRRSQTPGLPVHLRSILTTTAEPERMRAYAVQHLAVLLEQQAYADEHAAILDDLRTHLDDAQLEVRREAFLALSRHGDPAAGDRIAAGLSGAAGAPLRDLYIRAAHSWDMRDLLPQIRGYLEADEDLTAVAAINVIGLWQDGASRSALQHILEHSDSRKRRSAAEHSLDLLP